MLKFFNTLSRKKEEFKPLEDRKVGLYTCGPTVYDSAHIGNLRTYIFEDVLRRALKYNGYAVKQAMNITDIDDKIIKRAKEENKDFREISERFTRLFFEDLRKLNIEGVEVYPKATDHIKEMINLIQKLLDKGMAYRGNDNSIYFNIGKFKDYGKLAHLDKEGLKIGSRIAADEYNKEEAKDFVLWKAKKEGEPSWLSPFGEGRPGWHIECSAMSMRYLGGSFDIHAGGVDNIFPHHENEIAQSEAATGKKFVNYWIHGEHLLVDGRKMAKSSGNFFTLKNLEERGFNPLSFRYLILTSHYRSPLNFTWESLKANETALKNLYEEMGIFLSAKGALSNEAKTDYENKFLEAINDDLNTPQAIAVLWEVVKNERINGIIKKTLLLNFDRVLGLDLDRIRPLRIPLKIRFLAARREIFRNNEQFIQSDQLRKKIEELGYIVEDTPQGPVILKK